MTNITIGNYIEKVLQILESFDYPSLVSGFDVQDVSRSMSGSIMVNYIMGLSPMMCAIIIWSLTLNEQVMPSTSKMVKH